MHSWDWNGVGYLNHSYPCPQSGEHDRVPPTSQTKWKWLTTGLNPVPETPTLGWNSGFNGHFSESYLTWQHELMLRTCWVSPTASGMDISPGRSRLALSLLEIWICFCRPHIQCLGSSGHSGNQPFVFQNIFCTVIKKYSSFLWETETQFYKMV